MATGEFAVIFVLEALLAGIGLAIAESTFMNALGVAGIRPDLVVLAVAVAASRTSFGRGMVLAFILGLTRDFFGGHAVGMNAFSLTVMAYILFAAEDLLTTDTWEAQVFFAFVGSLVFEAVFAALKLVMPYDTGSITQILGMIVGTSVYTALLAPLAFALTSRARPPSYMRLRLKYVTEHETIPENKV